MYNSLVIGMKFTINDFLKYKFVVFDLDNTLYNERDYLFGAYEKISEFCGATFGIDNNHIYNYLVQEFDANGRQNLFNKLIDFYKLPVDQKELLLILRTYSPMHKYELYPQSVIYLDFLIERQIPVAILTNGNELQQQNKIININWGHRLNYIKVYFAAKYAPKPAPDGLYKILTDFKLDKSEMLFVGDALVDEQCAANATVDFINILEIDK